MRLDSRLRDLPVWNVMHLLMTDPKHTAVLEEVSFSLVD
jgi:hypothetical protein